MPAQGSRSSAHPPADAPPAAVQSLIERFNYPTARVQFGVAARGIATAAMDLSDGLVGDLPKLAQASGLAAHVAVDQLPLSDAHTGRGADCPGARVGAVRRR